MAEAFAPISSQEIAAVDIDFSSALNDLKNLATLVGPHWPFLLYAFIFAFIGEVSKRHIFSPANEAKLEHEADKMWNRGKLWRVPSVLVLTLTRTPYEYHPCIAGFFLGLVRGLPVSPGIHHGVQSVLYCMGAGIASLSLYAFVHGATKFWWKYVLRQTDPAPEIVLPGEEAAPAEEAPKSGDAA